MKQSLVAFLLFVSSGCGPKDIISENRMLYAPPREETCALELIQVDMTSITFNQQWDMLGFVSFGDREIQDPYAQENRDLLRPRACAMGGTAVAVVGNASARGMFGYEGSSIVYMVLRPKTAAGGSQPL